MARSLKPQAISKLVLGIYGVALLSLILVQLSYEQTISEHSAEFKQTSQDDARLVADEISHSVHMLYQGLRTIARLPGTRSIDRYATSLSVDARTTIQELYNNLYTNISLSEMYIVPRGFDPNTIDPITGKPSEPILSFDQFIVGRHADNNNSKQTADIEELEEYEYQLMKKQLTWLEQNYPTENHFSGLLYPAVTGPEVITCDNTFFSPSQPDNTDRQGMVYSVPFYDTQGQLQGMITGVVLTRVLQDLIPSANYALVNTKHNYVILPKTKGIWQDSFSYIKQGKANPGLYHSDVLKLHFMDKSGQWLLWVGHEAHEFFGTDEIIAYARTKHIMFLFILLIAAALHGFIYQQRKQRSLVEKQNEMLESKIKERTLALTLSNEELVKANYAKTNFLSRVSHELRTPLNAIIGYSELILHEELSNAAQVKEDINKIHSSGAHLLNLIDEVLDIAKIESGKMQIDCQCFEPVVLVEELIDMIKATAAQKQITLRTDIPPLDDMYSDKTKLKQILLNLLSNAVKFTEQGEIVLSIRQLGSGNEELMEFKVCDTGIGIDAKKLEHIFDEFYQAHSDLASIEPGTGLGLAISMRLASLLHGKLTVESQPQCGSCFTLTLPCRLGSSAKTPG